MGGNPMKRVFLAVVVVLAAAVAGGGTAFAQKPVERASKMSKSATITAINKTTRVVTVKDDKGAVEDIRCGPEVLRFDELKVGDVVKFDYYEATVYEIAKPGAPAAVAAEQATVRGQGVKPSGAFTNQVKLTVTVTAIDPAGTSVTVKKPDGQTMVAQVKDKKNIEGLKVGDVVSITFTEALMITVDPPKK
jgi:hypothetical protein